mgnify:FL=1
MYRKEYTETIFRTGSHTSRKSSVKQHEMAALREMEQMILAAEAVPAGAEALERATAHLEQFLQQVRQKRILDEKQRAMEAFRQQFENGYTWRNGFLRNVARFGDREALIEPESGTVWTYTQLNAEANRLSHALLRAGLQKGDVVMVQLHNCPEFVFAYLACHKTGMVFCPVNFRLSAKEITDCMDNSRPKVFLLEPETQAEVDMALRRTAHAPQILLTTDARAAHAYADFTADCPATEPELPWELSVYDETLRLFTSGTTGRQKSVCLTSINEVLSAHDVMIHFPFSFTDRSMNTTPWFHRGGLHSGGITPTLYAGGTVIIQRKFQPEKTLDMVQQYGLTFLIRVPNVLELLAEAQQKQPRDLSSLRTIVTMGSPLARAACIRYQTIANTRIHHDYGTTETVWNTFLRPDDLPEMAGSAGRSCVDDDVRVIKVYEDRVAEPDDLAATDGSEVGEVIIRSNAKSAAFYFGNPAETRRRFHDGFFYTNDLGTWDENHYFHIVGRKDDMIISGGENIYPVEVEEVLNLHPAVKDCIVTAAPDSRRGEIVTAYVIAAAPSLTAQELERYCKESPLLANYKRPHYYRFVSELPRNVTGKKMHYVMKQLAELDLQEGRLIRV